MQNGTTLQNGTSKVQNGTTLQNGTSKVQSSTIVVILPDSGERYLTTSLFKVKDNIQLNLFNTIERKKVLFKPLEQGKVSIYTCGPTVHKPLNVGQYRRFISSDLLCRYLEYCKLTVKHVINITDLDDKTIKGSEKTGESLPDFTNKNMELFRQDLELLNIREAQAYPRVSDHVEEMVRLAGALADKGFAYEKLHSLYFDLSSLAAYGGLSGVDLNKIRVGATVDLDNYEKDNPRDFTLLKRVGLSELKRGICINTRWGNVRPSLHLQCAALSMTCLGEQFDIHTGSRELLFPHHENEVAISLAATGTPPAKYWMHCDSVQYDGTLGNDGIPCQGNVLCVKHLEDLTLTQLMKMGWKPRLIRFWLLSAHYRKPLILSQNVLRDAGRSLEKLDRCIYSLMDISATGKFSLKNASRQNPHGENSPRQNFQAESSPRQNFSEENFHGEMPGIDQLLYDIKNGFSMAMDDDLKISAVFAALFKNVRILNRLMDKKHIDAVAATSVLNLFREIDEVLKIFDFNPGGAVSFEIQKILDAREIARRNNNWEEADRLREQLVDMGVEIHDKKI